MSCETCPCYNNDWCVKTGYRIDLGYICEDAWINLVKNKKGSRPPRRTKHERDRKYKQHLKRMAEELMAPAYYKETLFRHGRYVENPNPRYDRYYIGSKFHKRMSNKAVRRFSGELHNGCQYKKIYDYWWKVC